MKGKINPTGRTRRGASPLLRVAGLLLGATAFLLIWVGVRTVQASRDASVRTGLDYEAFLLALDDLIAGAGDSALIRFDPVEERISPRRSVTFDTITILADVEAFPAFDRAGFLYDQVQAYNRFQMERLALGRMDPDWYDRLRAYNPSVFRSARRPDGSQGLARAPAAWGLRVRSPLEGEWNGEIRAHDVVRDVGLLSPRMSVPLRKPVSLVRPVDGRRQLCEFVPSPGEVRVYCLSEERIAQATLRFASDDRSRSWALAGWADLWVDGRRIAPGDSVEIHGGDLLGLAPLEPVVFGDHWEGVLSSKQWVNGRMRRRGELSPPLDLFYSLGAGPASSDGRVSPTAHIDLSVSAEASGDLTRQFNDFLRTELDVPLDFGMIVLARIPDGEIVAVAEAGERANRGRSSLLERVAPGSAVKPLLAAAVLSQRPTLSALKIPARSGTVSTVLGMPSVGSRRAFTTALNCEVPQGGLVDLRYFLRCSNNEYAASLLVAGLVEDGIPGSNWRGSSELALDGTRVPRATLLRSPLSEGLSDLFDVPADPTIADAMGRSRRVWEGMSFSDGSPVRVAYELLPSESRPALLAPGAPEGTDLSLLYRYAFGAWENQWTLLDLTTSFARVVSDRRVQLRFFPDEFSGDRPGSGVQPSDSGGGGPADPSGAGEGALGLGQHSWYSDFLAGLRDVAIDGTARGLRSSWTAVGLPSTVFAKTGTLNEPGEPTPSDDLFAKSLLFAVGEPSEDPGGPLACGIVGGIYVRFSEGPSSGTLPSYQVDFARRRLGSFLRDYWDQFQGCPDISMP
jgi:hypothetical protein